MYIFQVQYHNNIIRHVHVVRDQIIFCALHGKHNFKETLFFSVKFVL